MIHQCLLSKALLTLLLFGISKASMAGDGELVLFDFSKPNAAQAWQPVNDGVMGGVSDGHYKITDQGTMEFLGTLSLENNGGFASVRSRRSNLGLKPDDILLIRLRGDGREYLLNLYVPSLQIAYSYRAAIPTKAGEWIEVRIPINDCYATSFGQKLSNACPVDASKVNAIGFMLSDKKAGPFKLEIAWVKVVGALSEPTANDGWMPPFDGKTLEGWTVRGGFASYKVKDGTIVGTTVQGSPNTFLCKGDFQDFVLEFEVMCDNGLNSGVQLRSHAYEKDGRSSRSKKHRKAGVVYGIQCDIDVPGGIGQAGRFYDESRRDRWMAEIKPEAANVFKEGQWNRYRIVVQGNRYASWINGVSVAEIRDDLDRRGFIGLQVHAIPAGTGPLHVRWRNIRIKELREGERVAIGAIAGSYYYGNGLGTNCSLVVKPEGRFSFIWRGCLGVYGKNEGIARVENDHLILTPEQPNDSEGCGGTPTDFIPVRWGDRLYLVSAKAGKAFCDEVNRGWEPRSNSHGNFYLRQGDSRKEVIGFPIVPKEWESLLQKTPIERQK